MYNNTVYKYELHNGINNVLMPLDAEALSVGFQGDKLCLWAKVNIAQKELVSYVFEVVVTGAEIISKNDIRFIGTARRTETLPTLDSTDGIPNPPKQVELVFHVFRISDGFGQWKRHYE